MHSRTDSEDEADVAPIRPYLGFEPPSPERSVQMAKVRRKNTTPELAVRRMAHSLGLRFRVHRKDLPGTPDIVFPGRRVVIFVNGCFWHGHEGCRRSKLPSSNVEFWKAKITGNVARDDAAVRMLRASGWRVEVIWECEAKSEAQIEARLRSIFPGTTRPT
jgi:DNA mismatch endonuclease, patch repair protein